MACVLHLAQLHYFYLNNSPIHFTSEVNSSETSGQLAAEK